jgi:hypothetical protein
MTDINSKVEQAFAAILEAADTGAAAIYQSKRSGDKSANCIIIKATAPEEEPPETGNFWVDVEITFKSVASVDTDGTDPVDASNTIWSNALEVLEVDTLAADLSALDDFHVFGFGEAKSVDSGQDEDLFTDMWKRRIYCCGSDM